MKHLLTVFVAIAVIAFASAAFAAGAHEALSCTGCHGIHTAKGEVIFAVAPNSKAINPATKKPYEGVTALCLGCHSENGGMGIAPVDASHSHPYGVKPNDKVAKVPDQLLRNGSFECVGCHDPHPSNPNYKYLRIDTKGGGDMARFCDLCHASKSGNSVSTTELFDSMDERRAMPKAAPAAPKK